MLHTIYVQLIGTPRVELQLAPVLTAQQLHDEIGSAVGRPTGSFKVVRAGSTLPCDDSMVKMSDRDTVLVVPNRKAPSPRLVSAVLSAQSGTSGRGGAASGLGAVGCGLGDLDTPHADAHAGAVLRGLPRVVQAAAGSSVHPALHHHGHCQQPGTEEGGRSLGLQHLQPGSGEAAWPAGRGRCGPADPARSNLN
ncbi:hypothetical protein HaLaN_10468, partial [Haematococcus lacustris]